MSEISQPSSDLLVVIPWMEKIVALDRTPVGTYEGQQIRMEADRRFELIEPIVREWTDTRANEAYDGARYIIESVNVERT